MIPTLKTGVIGLIFILFASQVNSQTSEMAPDNQADHILNRLENLYPVSHQVHLGLGLYPREATIQWMYRLNREFELKSELDIQDIEYILNQNLEYANADSTGSLQNI